MRVNQNFRFCKLDICDQEGVFGLFEEEKPDAEINFAAESHVDCSIEDHSIFLQTNIIGAATMMEASRKFGNVRYHCKSQVLFYHQVSTDEVYGDLPLDRPDWFFTETTIIRTSSSYSSSKVGADLLAMAYQPRSTMNWVGCRKRSLRTASKRLSGGILKTEAGGKRLSAGNNRTIMRKCMKTDNGEKNESFCYRYSWTVRA